MSHHFLRIVLLCLLGAAFPSLPVEGGDSLDKMADDFNFRNARQFITLGRQDRALEALHEYLEIYADGNHRAEALRLIAEVHYGRFDYQKAVNAYRSLAEEFSTADDGIAAAYYLGICYRKMGFDDRAQETFGRIVAEHPGSRHAAAAQVQLDLIDILAGK